MQLYCSFVELKLALNSINPNPILNRTCFIPLDPDFTQTDSIVHTDFFFSSRSMHYTLSNYINHVMGSVDYFLCF